MRAEAPQDFRVGWRGWSGPLAAIARRLLASDVTEMLPGQDLEQVVLRAGLGQVLALHNGGKDNITVVVAQYTIPGPGEAQPPLADTADHPDQAPVDSTSEYPLPTEDFSALQ